jgi:Flp pilus assembly protein TadB
MFDQPAQVGAAFGGALGVAASPLVVPGLALAALLGGAGGYQWARYWGSQDRLKQLKQQLKQQLEL